jgi:hypothetical protein
MLTITEWIIRNPSRQLLTHFVDGQRRRAAFVIEVNLSGSPWRIREGFCRHEKSRRENERRG